MKTFAIILSTAIATTSIATAPAFAQSTSATTKTEGRVLPKLTRSEKAAAARAERKKTRKIKRQKNRLERQDRQQIQRGS